MTEWPKKFVDRSVGKRLFDFMLDEQDNYQNAKYDLIEEIPHLDRLVEIYDSWLNRSSDLESGEKIYFCLCSFARAQLFGGIAQYLRGHLTSGFMSARLAMEAAVYGEAIASDFLTQEEYFTDVRKRNGIPRHFRNLQRNNELPNARIVPLLDNIGTLSSHAAHAEPKVWLNRVDESKPEYFSFSMFETVESPNHFKYFFHAILWFQSLSLQSFLAIGHERFGLETAGFSAAVDAWQSSMEENKKQFDISGAANGPSGS